MRNVQFLALIAIFVVAACNSKTDSSTTTDFGNVEKTTTSPFTDTVNLDTFKVALKGTKSKGNALIFRIISFKGSQIYQTQINTDELIKDNVKLKTESDKMKFLSDKVKYFFEDEHFLWPAVMPDELADQHVPDKEFHNELKQSQLNGFNYHTGTESKLYIAWSEKDKKVKVYYKL